MFAASFGRVFMKSFQQKNVAGEVYRWVLPTSYIMFLMEVYVIATIAQAGFEWMLVLSVGTGGGLGCMAAMWIHNRMFHAD